jgi:hypothetical protein
MGEKFLADPVDLLAGHLFALAQVGEDGGEGSHGLIRLREHALCLEKGRRRMRKKEEEEKRGREKGRKGEK